MTVPYTSAKPNASCIVTAADEAARRDALHAMMTTMMNLKRSISRTTRTEPTPHLQTGTTVNV